MAKEILDKIKDTEKEADEIILKANENAKSIFEELESKLHPQSIDLALFRFQLKALTGE